MRIGLTDINMGLYQHIEVRVIVFINYNIVAWAIEARVIVFLLIII